ncbi:bifunctional hydroxymethylpyrimidine kinase/phosphomethylpyrimidine kinase [Zhaonella formicivorans]|uniref:bifunctional hydroxymethylpyrimidine kinase/phosphomethylpyrimidine kinase n=1 Tax=Zhaonella formicivorans TaxID=2528593 RepID=UPI0010DBBA31
MKKVLTIAGSDSSGGAGIQADLKTFSAHGVFGMSVITAVTAQNTQGVWAVQDIEPEIIGKQITAVFEDIQVDAVKIGMVSQENAIKTIAHGLVKFGAKNVVLDPVMISKSGFNLLQPEAKEALIAELLPLAVIATPNIHEAQAITGMEIRNIQEMEEAAEVIFQMGPRNVLVKGGHLDEEAVDVLFDGKEMHHYKSHRIHTKNTHGTGCTLSSAIASNLALGYSVPEAVEKAKQYITIAIEHSLAIGKGVGPTNHFYILYKKAGVL